MNNRLAERVSGELLRNYGFYRWRVTFGVRSGIGLQNGRARPRLPERTDPKIYFNIYGETIRAGNVVMLSYV